MPTLKANHRVIAAAPAIGGKRTRYRIEGVDGLWLDVSPKGNRVWYVRYQPGGRGTRHFRYYKIGNLKQHGLAAATSRAKQVMGKVYGPERLDPQAERIEKAEAAKIEGVTFGTLFEDWYARHAEPTLARATTDRIVYRCHIEPSFAKNRVAELKRVEIGRFRDKVAREASPLTSNSVVELINRVLNWAVDEGIIEVNPGARLRKVGVKRPRERVLSETDIPKFWNALAAMETLTGEHIARAEKGRMLSPATRSILRLLLLTGQRRSEVVEAQKSEFELDGPEPIWTIPGARTKNRLLHRLPLCPMAVAEFRKAIAASPEKSPFVFPSPEDPLKRPISADAVTRAMARMIAEIKIPTVSPHDLRRTAGTEMAKLGLPVHVRSLVLNHSPMSRGITDAVYNRYAYDKEKRQALEAWEERLAQLLAYKPPSALTPVEAA
jgi:integrase